MTYDSKNDTLNHIDNVYGKIENFSINMMIRAKNHDASKLKSPEKELFDEYTPKLSESTYGSNEYKDFLVKLKPALDHHYNVNKHHPEYFGSIDRMSLVDIVEMLMDWWAASERHADGDITKSIEINQKRFGYSDELRKIFLNIITALRCQYCDNPKLKQVK